MDSLDQKSKYILTTIMSYLLATTTHFPTLGGGGLYNNLCPHPWERGHIQLLTLPLGEGAHITYDLTLVEGNIQQLISLPLGERVTYNSFPHPWFPDLKWYTLQAFFKLVNIKWHTQNMRYQLSSVAF